MEETLEALYELSRNFLQAKVQKYRRYFIEDTQLKERFSILTGQRGVGKTTLLIQYLLDYVHHDRLSTKILYVPVDHFILGQTPLYEIAKQFDLMGGEFIAFDEIHKYEQWSKELKSIYDTFPKLKIIASGSSALEIHKGSHDLSRRAIQYRIPGLSFREYLELSTGIDCRSFTLDKLLTKHDVFADEVISLLRKENRKVLLEFHHYLKHGYYPYFFELKDESKFSIILEQNIHTTIESDLTALYPQLKGGSIKKIKQLLTFIAQNVPFIPQWNRIRQILEIGDERTLKAYFKYLEDAELIRTLNKSSTKLKTLEETAKVYLHNPNVMYTIGGGRENLGTMRELLFLNMLSLQHAVTAPWGGDFLIDRKMVFEIGGAKKGFKQLQDHQTGYVVADNLEIGVGKKIPLWLFGFLY